MGRPSKLSPEQWADFDRRRMDGESRRALCREFSISEASAREREEKIGRSPTVQRVAHMLVETDAALRALPISAQVTAQNLAERLKSISGSLAAAAELGAKTSHRLHSLANSQVAKIDDADPTNSISDAALRSVAMLTKVANEAAAPGMGLIAATKGARMDDPETEGGLASRMRKQRAIDGV
jgi:hypothetical protein